MNLVKTVLAILITIGLSNMNNHDDVVFRTFTSFDGKKYEFVLNASRLTKTPSWLESEDNPPLSPRKALAVGREFLARLVKDAEKWQVERIVLQSVGAPEKWIYVIEVRPPIPPGGLEGKLTASRLVVLMDGTALKADAVVDKDQKGIRSIAPGRPPR